MKKRLNINKKTILPTFFGGIVRYKSPEAYSEQLGILLENSDAIYEIFAKSVYSIGRINAYKNKYFKNGIISFVIAITLELIIIVSLYVRLVI